MLVWAYILLFLLHHASPLIYYLTPAQTSHSCSSGLFISSFVLCLTIAGHGYPDKLQVLVWLSFSPANHTSQAQTSHKYSSGFIFYFFTPLPPLPLTYYLTQAQTSHHCLSGHFLAPSFSINPSQVMCTQMSSKCSSGFLFHLPTTRPDEP